MTTVNIREFTRHIYKYLQPDTNITVTNNGKPKYTIYIKSYDGEDVVTEERGILNPNMYRCGCKRTDKTLCPKHQRF
ncbi:hypothetical protein LCGC14_1248740 [marine sediment metagenome]|uniref:Uncharacterized protein n=1 Tax=marine sediment metagenome TaxID=412755 RepID=A0A0F9LQQ7_9ZZZZ